MKECTAKYAEAKAPAAMRQEKNDTVASRAKEGCDEHLRSMDEERARGREELARVLEDLNQSPRGARTRKSTACNELLKRMERERTDALEREEVVRGQLNGITTLIHQQREEMAQRHKLMEERWNEKQGHREEKEARQDEFIQLARGILHDREQERAEREAEREANAGQPSKSSSLLSDSHLLMTIFSY